jgi:alkylation response protein AidB-like acyl-CoA dehydrogenase
MYLAPDGEEAEIASAAAEFLADAMPIARLHAPDSADMGGALRQTLGEMGWFALAVPEAAGGSGLSAIEHALFFREAGRQCAPVDVLAQCLAANAAANAELRGRLIAGECGVALAFADGERRRIIGSGEAEFALLVTLDNAFIYPLADSTASQRPSLDPANSQHITESLGEPLERFAGRNIWQLGQLGTAAMLVGIAENALELTVEYAKVRETFGIPVPIWRCGWRRRGRSCGMRRPR